MPDESPWAKWQRFSSYSWGDFEKATRSSPQRRRRLRVHYLVSIAIIWLVSALVDLITNGHDSGWSLIVDVVIPNPFPAIVIAYLGLGAALAKKSKLSDEEARALADEVEEQERETREFAKWLWTWRGRGPGQK